MIKVAASRKAKPSDDLAVSPSASCVAAIFKYAHDAHVERDAHTDALRTGRLQVPQWYGAFHSPHDNIDRLWCDRFHDRGDIGHVGGVRRIENVGAGFSKCGKPLDRLRKIRVALDVVVGAAGEDEAKLPMASRSVRVSGEAPLKPRDPRRPMTVARERTTTY